MSQEPETPATSGSGDPGPEAVEPQAKAPETTPDKPEPGAPAEAATPAPVASAAPAPEAVTPAHQAERPPAPPAVVPGPPPVWRPPPAHGRDRSAVTVALLGGLAGFVLGAGIVTAIAIAHDDHDSSRPAVSQHQDGPGFDRRHGGHPGPGSGLDRDLDGVERPRQFPRPVLPSEAESPDDTASPSQTTPTP